MPATVRRFALIVASLLLATLLATSPASAHSFLATTRPAQGERLSGPPNEVALQLSEPVERDSAQVVVADAQGRPLKVGRLELDSGGAVVRVPLVSPGDGLYRVTWHVTSAVDGHESAGEFAFAAGDEATLDTIASTDATNTPPSMVVTAATWLLLAGWSVAFGAAALFLRANDGMSMPGRRRSWIRAGALPAVAGLAVRAAAATGQRATTVTLISTLAVAAALVLARSRRSWPPLAALAMFAIVWPARGHAAITAPGWVLDSVHLAAAGLWVGGLSVVLVALVDARRRGSTDNVLPLARLYGQTAVVAVLVLLTTGVALGWTLVPDFDALVTDGYGQLVALKAALLLAALAAAAVARHRLARANVEGVRRAIRPEYLILGIVLVVAARLLDTAPEPGTLEALLGPPPIDGPVARAAALAGQVTVDVQAGEGRLDIRTPKSSGSVDADLTVSAVLPDGTEIDLHPRPCGTGCATLGLDLPDGQTDLTVTATASSRQGGTTTLPLAWPPPDEDPELFERMRAAMETTGHLRVAESDNTYPSVHTEGSPMSGDQLVDLMPWAGGGVTDVRPVLSDPGRFTFYLPGSHMWFDVTTDRHGRLLTQRLVNPGHDIRYRFRYPPQASTATPAPAGTPSNGRAP